MQRIGYRDAYARQPESLAEGLAAVRGALDALDLAPFRNRAIAFAGIGASYQAALAGAEAMRRRGARAFAFFPSELDGADGAADAFVALSASGQSREITDVMKANAGRPRLAICRAGGNPLAEITGAVLPTSSGADNGASSTGYTGMLLAIGLLIDRVSGAGEGPDWARLPEAVSTLLASARSKAGAAAALLRDRTSIDLVGAGTGFATAGEGAMLIREAVRVPAVGWDTLNYLHGPMESQDGRTGLIALGEGREVKIAQDVAAFHCPSVLVTRRTDVPDAENLVVMTVPGFGDPVADAILKIVAVQMVVGDMQDAAALTNCTFRYRQTDTKLKPWSPTEL